MNTITEVTRRAIIDYLSVGTSWSGRLEEADFLSRMYDLTKMPSLDHRFSNARGDIWQHRTNNNDWPDEWVFTDPRFNILWASDDELLKFLCETVHPVVRPDEEEAQIMVSTYNIHLRKDGWEKVDRQIQEIKFRLDTANTEEHYQAIGLISREALISLTEATYDAEKYPSIDGISASKTDAGRMLESLLEIELKGGTNEEARSYAKAVLKLAIALQHKRTANYKMAALCAEATISVVNIVTILCK